MEFMPGISVFLMGTYIFVARYISADLPPAVDDFVCNLGWLFMIGGLGLVLAVFL